MHLLVVLTLIFYLTANQELIKCQSTDDKKQVVVVALPGKSDTQYYDHLQRLADFSMEMDNATVGKDHLFIVYDKTGLDFFKGYTFKNAHLIEVKDSLDMWMRDFPPCMPRQMIDFVYKPQYLSYKQAKHDEGNFEKFAKMVGLPPREQSNIVLECGNIVENGVDAAIITARAYKDNPDMSKEDLVNLLKARINRKIAVIPDPKDTTGHADGIVSFVEENLLLIARYEDDPDGPGYYDALKEAVLKVFPDLKIVPLPSYTNKGKSHGFSSAEGSYANSLVTYNAVYMPFFSNEAANERAFGIFQSSTSKQVNAVPAAGKLHDLGGSLRCMTWQIDQDHPVAKSLFAFVEKGSRSPPVTIL